MPPRTPLVETRPALMGVFNKERNEAAETADQVNVLVTVDLFEL